MGVSITMKGAAAGHREVHPEPDDQGVHRRRPRGRSPARTRSAWSPPVATCRSATSRTRRSRRARSASSTACATRSPATWRRWPPTASLILLGRGSQVINSGGEKIFPEEVEEAVKRVDGVLDCLVRRPRRRALRAGRHRGRVHGRRRDGRRGRRHRRRQAAARRVQGAEEGRVRRPVPRAPNGKADYKRGEAARDRRGSSPGPDRSTAVRAASRGGSARTRCTLPRRAAR